jgi:hypothetical protein
MTSRKRIRGGWFLLAILCLFPLSTFAGNTLVFHLARFEYTATTSDCEDATTQLVRKAKGDVYNLQKLLSRLPKTDECAQAVQAEIMLAMKVTDYLSNHGITAVPHIDEYDDLKQQLERSTPVHGDDPFLLRCLISPISSNTSQLEVTCTAAPLHGGDNTKYKTWHREKPPLDKFVDLFCADVSQNVGNLCQNAQKTVRQ